MEHLDMQRAYKAAEEWLTKEYYVLKMKKITNQAKIAHRQAKLNTAFKNEGKKLFSHKKKVVSKHAQWWGSNN